MARRCVGRRGVVEECRRPDRQALDPHEVDEDGDPAQQAPHQQQIPPHDPERRAANPGLRQHQQRAHREAEAGDLRPVESVRGLLGDVGHRREQEGGSKQLSDALPAWRNEHRRPI